METSLREMLKREVIKFLSGFERCIVCGMGNPLRGDDAFGVMVARKLIEVIGKESPKVMVMDCGNVPELYTREMIGFDPSHVIFVDAVDAKQDPGSIIVMNPKGDRIIVHSTHRLPINLLVKYLDKHICASYLLIGCQPVSVEFTRALSEVVMSRVELVSQVLAEILKPC